MERRKRAFSGLCDMVMHEFDVKCCMNEHEALLNLAEALLAEYRALSARSNFKSEKGGVENGA